MVFSSMTFLCAFLPVVWVLYWLMPMPALRNGWLIVASLLFYAYGEPYYIFLMLFCILGNYLFALGIDHAKAKGRVFWLVLAVVINIGLLFVFKYLDMAVHLLNTLLHTAYPLPGLPLPVGISFFTFQALSYVIDVYRKECKAQRNLFHVMLYISFFPQLIAGPIVKYHDIEKEITKRLLSLSESAAGLQRFCVGLAKKVLIANQMAIVTDALFAMDPARFNICSAWLAAVCYVLQIYFDFSGYSDMAIGLGRLFGFHFQENFNYPYISGTIQEFWRRWHISLSTWFKEYLYIPLGGNRKGTARTYLNKLIVFFATGLWHGANWTFVLWGLWHGFWIILEQQTRMKNWMPKVLGHVVTMLIVILGFVVFRADSVGQGLAIITQMFCGWNFSASAMGIFTGFFSGWMLCVLMLALILCVPYTVYIPKNLSGNISVCYAGSLLLLFLSMLSLASGTYNPFIYFRF